MTSFGLSVRACFFTQKNLRQDCLAAVQAHPRGSFAARLSHDKVSNFLAAPLKARLI